VFTKKKKQSEENQHKVKTVDNVIDEKPNCILLNPSGLSRIWASPSHHLWHYFYFWSDHGTWPDCCVSTSPSLGRGRVAHHPMRCRKKRELIFSMTNN